MVFSNFEMVTMYNQAKDKRKQIEIFCHTEGKTEEEVRKILLENGVDPRKLPRERRKKENTMPKFKNEEDRIIEELEQQVEKTRPLPGLEDVLGYIEGLMAEREMAEARIREVDSTLARLRKALGGGMLDGNIRQPV